MMLLLAWCNLGVTFNRYLIDIGRALQFDRSVPPLSSRSDRFTARVELPKFCSCGCWCAVQGACQEKSTTLHVVKCHVALFPIALLLVHRSNAEPAATTAHSQCTA